MLATKRLKISLVLFGMLSSLAAHSQPARVEPLAMAQPIELNPNSKAGTFAAGTPPGMSSPANEVKVGKGAADKQSDLTMREIEALQKKAWLLELKVKVKDLEDSLDGAKKDGQGRVDSKVQMGGPFAGAPIRFGTGAPMFLPPAPVMNDEPHERVVNIVATQSRSRADLMRNGSRITVKVGDSLENGWKVSAISTEGVEAERKRFVAMPNPALKNQDAKGGSKKAPSTSTPKTVQREEVMTVKLKPADDIAMGLNVLDPQQAPQSNSSPVVPPLPVGMAGADSTRVTPGKPISFEIPQNKSVASK